MFELIPEGERAVFYQETDAYALLDGLCGLEAVEGMSLLLEGTSMSTRMRATLSQLAVPNELPAPVRRARSDGELSRHWHLVRLDADRATRIRETAEQLAEPEIGDHLHLFSGDRLVGSYHHIGDGPVVVSVHAPRELREWATKRAAASPEGCSRASRARPMGGPFGSRTSARLAALAAVASLGLILLAPFTVAKALGVALAAIALLLATTARRNARTRKERRAGRLSTLLGLLASALAIALVVSIILLLAGVLPTR